MEFDANLIKLVIAIIGFVLGIAGLGLFLIKTFFARVFAAIKTLFDAKEDLQRQILELERTVNKIEKTILVMDPNQTQILKR
jgi:hypothetical protein